MEKSLINSVFVDLFENFTKTPVKEHVYSLMSKKILQDKYLYHVGDNNANGHHTLIIVM